MPNAILSTFDKTGLVEFAQGLCALGWRLIASGGTARLLQHRQIPVTRVEDYTHSPEVLGGRVKTLHPAIHAGILARTTESDQAQLADLGWESIDLVAVNLYPFEATIAKPEVSLEEAIEDIDIGGVALLRAAAKNHQRVTLVTDPLDYDSLLQDLKSGGVSQKTRLRLALEGYRLSARYDAAIASFLEIQTGSSDAPADRTPLQLKLYPTSRLRYGENPHQNATLFGYEPHSGPLGGELLSGKALSYNNLLDLDAAWRAAVSFDRPAVCIMKHLSPCGLACAKELALAFQDALASDPVSAFGGVIAVNHLFDEDTANALGDLFVECIVAPGYSPGALAVLASRKNLRIVRMPDTGLAPLYELRSVNQGVLRQSIDLGDPDETEWRVVSQRAPTEDEWQSLRFAWKACQHVKSNAIVFARGEATVGIGGGQPNRVDCVRIAAQRARGKARGAVMASDAFFPFPDSVEEAARAGISAIISPGGSVRDVAAIEAADKNHMSMVFTAVRHFRH